LLPRRRFRAGVIFAVFEAAAINPAIILEAMFGQTKGMPIGASDTAGIGSASSASRLGGLRTSQEERDRQVRRYAARRRRSYNATSGGSPVATRKHRDSPALRQPAAEPTNNIDAFNMSAVANRRQRTFRWSSRRGN